MDKNKFSLIQTEDGTSTIYYDEYSEAMHSTSGAYEESLLKHIYPSRILEQSPGEINVLDIGFGMGYNVLALVAELEKINYPGRVNVISLERDRSYLSLLDTIRFNDDRDHIYNDIKRAFSHGEKSRGNISIKIILGDARDSLARLENMEFHALFQDPFSPFKNPELWSLEYFSRIYEITSSTGILTTYSSAPQIRKALIDSGFIIGRGPSVGKKREGTIATKSGVIKPIESNEILELEKNVKSTPYRDLTFQDSREEILERRLEEMRLKRSRACHQAHRE